MHLVVKVKTKRLLKRLKYQAKKSERWFHFLASDDIKGRDTGSEGIAEAATYIEKHLESFGVKPYYDTYRDNFKVKEVPIFAKLLSLASLQGIADLLTGEGIRFSNFEMNFSKQKNLTTIEEMYAIGPAVSILMDGYTESKKIVSLRGTLVPATTINRTIASIPLLGKILVGSKDGEGVFGVSFKIKGTPKNLKTLVNPVKTLTPRFITRTLEKIKRN